MVHVFVETIRSLIFKIIMFNSWILWWKLHYPWCCSENSNNQVSHGRANCIKGLFSSAHSHDAHLWKWKWCDIRPSMVTHTRNLCSAFNPSKVHTHSSEHTHTMNTHPEQWAAIYAAAPREQLGVRCLAQGHLSRGIEGGESAVHSLPPPTITAGPETRTRNLWITSPTL